MHLTKKSVVSLAFSLLFLFLSFQVYADPGPRLRVSFDADWKFHLGDTADAKDPSFDDHGWRQLNLPHDWSIEGSFNKDNPATFSGGALPGGIGWYRKTFTLPATDQGKMVFIDFDGVYMNSEVWINGYYLGKRPYGYSSFRYDLTPYLHYGNQPNVVAVKVDNSEQPNSRWYSGSGIYRNVWLVTTDKIYINHWGTYITTPSVNKSSATVSVQTTIRNRTGNRSPLLLQTTLVDANGKAVAQKTITVHFAKIDSATVLQNMTVTDPVLWSTNHPYLYKAVSKIISHHNVIDNYTTVFGIRYFHFDADNGFSLDGKSMKIRGVCDHHDLGCLGAAVNTRALQRQLQILKAMGCNAIRTSHNPPAPELLQLCDKMGFIVMDEAFDCWKKGKNPYDYHLYWDEWHKRDLEDMIRRDRNHPSVIIWSIGNEIPDQWDSAGGTIARELAGIVRSLDTTRPITSATNSPESKDNYLAHSGALDLIGYNYDIAAYKNFHKNFPGQKFIATETTSALETRGHYDMPSDSIFVWPTTASMNADYTCSAYDNCRAPWGSLHEDAWRAIKENKFASGMFIWTGFDYLGEPTPYGWPARSSYFGIIDLAGFPKDIYYMYQSEWTDSTVLHIFPYWNWQRGDSVDVWAYYNHADKVTLFLNGKSLGSRSKKGDAMHVVWRVAYAPGTLKAISYKDGKEVKETIIRTAGLPYKIVLSADSSQIQADGKDLSFVTVKIEDKIGTIIPHADNLVNFKISGPGFIAGVDNGCETDHEPFKANYRKVFNGLALAVIQSDGKKGTIALTAIADGLKSATVHVTAR
jgi:beta-galactosidase